jgi:hypothetical protein
LVGFINPANGVRGRLHSSQNLIGFTLSNQQLIAACLTRKAAPERLSALMPPSLTPALLVCADD